MFVMGIYDFFDHLGALIFWLFKGFRGTFSEQLGESDGKYETSNKRLRNTLMAIAFIILVYILI